ncbi:MAG: hypothetical protein IPO24_15150 [Bacteroidetes bacterium]|nr:hypothetical protein [Bacteroidota bacterium]
MEKYLQKYKEPLTPKINKDENTGRKVGNYKWYEIQDVVDYYRKFELPKIIFPNLQNVNKFAFDETGVYLNAPSVFLPSNDKALLAVLNSKVVWHFLKSICVIRSGGYIEVKPQYFEQIPIPDIDPNMKTELFELTEKIIQAKTNNLQAEIPSLESQIDQLVYQLYNLTEEEIKIVEGN